MIGPALAISWLLVAAPAAASGPVRRALVVAYNGADDASLETLRFADDDGILWAETLERLGVETTLLTEPDEETTSLGSPFLAKARAPTPQNVRIAVEAIRKRNLADRAAGRSVDALLVYVGHGQTDEAGRSFLSVRFGRIDRTVLYEKIIDRLSADYVHLFIDACRASGVIGARGRGDPAVLKRLRAKLEKERLASRPNVGAVFAESADGETHEWSRIRAGVFSHVARSALLGAADVNGDGLVEYSEFDAFVAASVAGVKMPRSRLEARTLPPRADPRRALVGPAVEGPRLDIHAGDPVTRVSIEDDLGVRLADVNRTPGEPMSIALPARSAYWIRSPYGELKLAPSQLAGGVPDVGPVELASRGPTEESLKRGLFAVAFGRGFYQEYVARAGLASVSFRTAPVVATPSAMAAPQVELEKAAEAGAAAASVELDIAVRQTAIELAASAGASSLDLHRPAWGLTAAWRRPGPGVRWGARLAWDYAPAVGLGTTTAAAHRAAVLALLGWEADRPVAPFAEAGVGWLLVAVSRPSGWQGDALAGSGRAAAGVRWELGGWRLRVALAMDLDLVEIDGVRAFHPGGGVQLGVEL